MSIKLNCPSSSCVYSSMFRNTGFAAINLPSKSASATPIAEFSNTERHRSSLCTIRACAALNASSAELCGRRAMSASCRGRAFPPGSSFAELLKEPNWKDEKRISLKNAANDDHRVRSHHVDYGVPITSAD